MGILDDVRSGLANAAGGNAPAGSNPVLNQVMQMISNPQAGGLQGIIQAFHDRGLGSVVSSWVSTGPNQAVSPDQIHQAIGSHVQQIAQATGLNPNAVASQLSTLLPTIIDKLTPQGTVPQGGLLEQGLSLLRSHFAQPAAVAAAPQS